MHGHWTIPKDLPEVAVDDGLSEQYVNMGIAIVTPISQILPLLDDPSFAGKREEATSDTLAGSSASAPSEPESET
jgi:hypothetical protein